MPAGALIILTSIAATGRALVAQAPEPGWAWHITPRPRIDLGGEDADSNAFFAQVNAAFRLRDGRLAVVDNSPSPVHYFGPAGQYLGHFGRKGAGPGEFALIFAVFRTPGDTLVAYDAPQGRITYITPSGTLGRTVTFGEPMQRVLFGRFGDGTFLARNNVVGVADRIQMMHGGPGGPRRDSIPWLRLRENGTVMDTIVRALAEAYDRPPSGGIRILRFTPKPAVLAVDSVLYVGTGEQYRVQSFDLHKRPLTTFTKPSQPVTVTAAHLKAWEEDLVSKLPPGMEAGTALTQQRKLPVAEYLPAHDRYLQRDPDLNLWVQDFYVPGAPHVVWSVFAPDGHYRGSVELPSRFRLLDVGRDYVLGTRPDDSDVLHVQLYDLVKRAP